MPRTPQQEPYTTYRTDNDKDYTKTELRPVDDKEVRELTDIKDEFERDVEAHEQVTEKFDDFEAMLLAKPNDSVSRAVGGHITDARISTIAMESSARVMAQMPSGTVKALSVKDKGKALLMDLVRQRYIIPNANYQHPFERKLRMWNFYKRVYGFMPVMYFWNVTDTYVGPDFALVHPRNFIPQRGNTSQNTLEYCWQEAWVNNSEVESYLDYEDDGWDKEVVQEIIDWAKNGKPTKDERKRSHVEKTRDPKNEKGTGTIHLVTKYEAGEEGRWITFCPEYDYKKPLRDIENPNQDGRLPFVISYNFPLLDSFYGLGDFERGKPIQFAMDGLMSYYFKSLQMSVYPPMIVNPNGVIDHTLKYAPGERWLEILPNSIRRFESSPQGLNTFQAAYSLLTGALLNQNGTTDTAINAEQALDSGFGKTPEALKMLGARENTRDNFDRTEQEQGIEELFDCMLNLVATQQSKKIDIDLFGEEINQIKTAGYDDIDDMLKKSESGEYAKLSISPSKIKDTTYKFYIDAGSTAAEDKDKQKGILAESIGMFSKDPALNEKLGQKGWTFDEGEAMRRYITLGGYEDVNAIIYKQTDANDSEDAQENQAEQAQQIPVDPMTGQPLQEAAPQPQMAPDPNDPVAAAGLDLNDPDMAAFVQGLGLGGQPQ